ncbi:PRC-barrel domain-containing protein [Fischerella sp. PCC 9605]|uniref:PRC-barrel domain-containing protein n=1 Tax=Fischerella sp. PCC 9605 TaxID=1173024 RepID=UPI00047B1E42|nr:PRC-barrel domain-containing protein [Fischerella sp. PCC 9605]
MALVKLDTYYPNYKDVLDNIDIKNFDVYGSNDEKVGSVQNILVDEDTGRFRYLIIDTGFWVFGKKVLLPIGIASIDESQRRVTIPGLTKQQVEDLPEFTEDLAIDRDYEESVRSIYRPSISTSTTMSSYDRDSYDYQQEPYFYDMSQEGSATFRTYEERLISAKGR